MIQKSNYQSINNISNDILNSRFYQSNQRLIIQRVHNLKIALNYPRINDTDFLELNQRVNNIIYDSKIELQRINDIFNNISKSKAYGWIKGRLTN